MKDLGDLHNAAVETDRPEMFKQTVESIVWRARLRQKERREQTSTTSTSLCNVDVVDVSKWGAVRFTDMGAPVPPGT